jgi:hypothetical protein
VKDGDVALTRWPLEDRRGTAASQGRQKVVEQLQRGAIESCGWPKFKIVAAESQRLCEATRGRCIYGIEPSGFLSFGLGGYDCRRSSFAHLGR